MSFPDKLGAEEIKAYTAKIDVLKQWLRENGGLGLNLWMRGRAPREV